MTPRTLAAVLAVPLLVAAAWAIGGALFYHPPVDLGGVVVVAPAGDRSPTPAAARPIHPPTRPGNTATVEPPPPPPTAPAAPTEAATVITRPAPTAGDDDDDDDGVDDGPRTNDTSSTAGLDPDDDGVDDDTDN